LTSPFADEPPAEVPLSRAPLVKVLAQLKFPVNARIDTTEGVARFQEALRDSYPIMRQEQQQLAISLPPGGIPGLQVAATSSSLWRLSALEDGWTVVLARDFVAIETSTYTSRDDFMNRFAQVLRAMETADLAPSVTDRMGVRYIDRIEGDDMLGELPVLVRREVLGVGQVELPERAEIVNSASQTHLRLDGMDIRASWGLLPPGAVLLPGLEAVDTKSWVLDVDVFAEQTKPFLLDDALQDAKTAADHAYRLFRWVVTPEFLRRHGGDV
jgi:uncharacterized protein (TIGR04255 family)